MRLLTRLNRYTKISLMPVIEQHTKNVRFCILCNYVNKITPAIQSRCTRFRFSPLPEKEVERKVDEVIEKEGHVYPFVCKTVKLISSVTITPDGKEALLKLSRGDMRRALNVLQVCWTLISLYHDEADFRHATQRTILSTRLQFIIAQATRIRRIYSV